VNSFKKDLAQHSMSERKTFDSIFEDLYNDVKQYLKIGSHFDILRMLELDYFLDTIRKHIENMNGQIAYYQAMSNILLDKRKQCSILDGCSREKRAYENYLEYKNHNEFLIKD